jgi:hypothetical protein
MIIRIMGEGQAELADSHLAELGELDDQLMARIKEGDEDGFRRTFAALLDRVRELGEPVPDDSLKPSGLILPAPEATLDEVRELLSDEGLIPSAV